MTISMADAESAVNWLRDNAERIGTARAQRLYMEQWIKTVRATIQSEATATGGLSAAASEIIALSSPTYLEALEAYREAIHIDERMRFLATAAEAKIECWRSIEATRRIEGKATE